MSKKEDSVTHATLSENGSLTIPAKIRKKWKLSTGRLVQVSLKGNVVHLTPMDITPVKEK